MSYNKVPEPEHIEHRIAQSSPIEVSDWRVLIVDDVFDNISIAEAVLRFNGAEVQYAINGREGLKMVESYRPNLILLDSSMPDMNGWKMHEELRKMPATASIPIIALTAHAMQGDKERVIKAGFDGYIAKPFSVTLLVEDIKNILETLNARVENS